MAKHCRLAPRTVLRIVIALTAAAAALGALWWLFFALKPYTIHPEQLQARYAHAAPDSQAGPVQLGSVEVVQVGDTRAWAQSLSFRSFDGALVLGRIVHPTDPADAAAADAAPGQRRVMLALHAMGRTQWRWWHGEFNGRPTIESTHRLAERALQSGHVVVALDARGHGDRKDPQQRLIARKLLRDMHLWGKREPYERLIIDTVKDYRVLLDWVERPSGLGAAQVRAAGYSMGAQMALLLAAVDARVRSVAAMVPPHLDAKVAVVAPSTVVSRLANVEVWLLTAEDDEHASPSESEALFVALPSTAKRHLRFPGGHVLPAAYVDQLQPWIAVAR